MKLYQLLVESRVDYLRNKYVPLISNTFSENNKTSNEMFDQINNIDPTNNKIYLQWFLNNLLKLNEKDFNIAIKEDAYKWKEYLTIYHKVKNKLNIDQRDINKLSLNDLKDIALEFKENEEEIGTKNEILDKKYKINENNDYLVYMFKTATEEDFKMYQLVSTNTEWCTRPNYYTFKDYINKSPLFVFINKNNRSEKYQFHEKTSQFMDKDDKMINDKLLLYFIKLISNYLSEDFAIGKKIGDSYGIINKQGEVIAKGFKWLGPFSEGIARVKFQDDSYGFINKQGKIIVKGFKNSYSFSEGFAPVQFKDDSFGYINTKGNIIAKGFKDAYSFNEGFITYEKFAEIQFHDNSYGYINREGEIYERDKKTLINKNDPRLKGIEIYPEKFI